MTKFQKQVEVQGTKKLDSVKGVQALELNEMKETEGGKVRWWMYIIAPVPSYIIGKFEKGCQCDVIPA